MFSAATAAHNFTHPLRSPQRLSGQLRVRSAASTARVELHDFHSELVPYEQAWQWQKAYAHRVADSITGEGEPLSEALLILQHPATYTLGTASTLDNLKFDPANPPFPLYRTERGGEVTYHGPGQLVLYPILNLRNHGKDLHVYLRQLEQVAIDALDSVSGIEGYRIPGRTGVWTSSGKIAATGVRASRWISYHGIALNVAPDLLHFDAIVPCGIADAAVSSVSRHLGLECAHGDSGGGDSARAQAGMHERDMLLREYSCALQAAFEDAFGVALTVSQERLVMPGPVADAALS